MWGRVLHSDAQVSLDSTLLWDFFAVRCTGTVTVASYQEVCVSVKERQRLLDTEGEILPWWPLNSPGGTETLCQARIELHTFYPHPRGDVYNMNDPFYSFDHRIHFDYSQVTFQSCLCDKCEEHQAWKNGSQTATCRISFTVFFSWWIMHHVNARCPVSTHCSRCSFTLKCQTNSPRHAAHTPLRPTNTPGARFLKGALF